MANPNAALETSRSLGALVLVLALATPALCADAPIVDRSIEHHGGELYRASRSELRVCSKSGCYDVAATIDGDLYEYDVRQEATADRPNRRVVSANDEVSLWLDGKPEPLTGEEEQRWRDWAAARVYFCFLPYRLRDPSVHTEDLGLERWGDRELHKVKVTFAAGSSTDASDEYLYWFDPESGRVEQFAYSYEGSPGGLRFRRGFNYRRIGGLLFFDQENWGVEGEGLSVDDLEPTFVETSLRKVSTITIEEPTVTALGGGSGS